MFFTVYTCTCTCVHVYTSVHVQYLPSPHRRRCLLMQLLDSGTRQLPSLVLEVVEVALMRGVSPLLIALVTRKCQRRISGTRPSPAVLSPEPWLMLRLVSRETQQIDKNNNYTHLHYTCTSTCTCTCTLTTCIYTCECLNVTCTYMYIHMYMYVYMIYIYSSLVRVHVQCMYMYL